MYYVLYVGDTLPYHFQHLFNPCEVLGDLLLERFNQDATPAGAVTEESYLSIGKHLLQQSNTEAHQHWLFQLFTHNKAVLNKEGNCESQVMCTP